MDARQFDAFGKERTTAGQHELANAMRALVARNAPELYEFVAGFGDDLFLEPLLFTYFAEPDSPVGLPQIVFGSVPPEARPEAIEVFADEHGRVYVPNVGYFLTERRETTLVLEWERTTDRYTLKCEDETVSHAFEPILYLPGTRIELLRHTDPLLVTRFRTTTSREQGTPQMDGRAEYHARHIERALARLAEHCPRYHEALVGVTRRIACFRAESVNSFASIAAQGVAFFNAGDEQDEVYFIDELVHQCGHIIFNAMTVRRQDFIAIDPETPLTQICSRDRGRRTVYDALHGLYTEHFMSQCMNKLDREHVYSGRQAHELLGRLSFITRKYGNDDENLSVPGVFTELGASVYQYFHAAIESLRATRPELLEMDMTAQPYTFDYGIFARNHPMIARSELAALAAG